MKILFICMFLSLNVMAVPSFDEIQQNNINMQREFNHTLQLQKINNDKRDLELTIERNNEYKSNVREVLRKSFPVVAPHEE